jgi:hypothetical protein
MGGGPRTGRALGYCSGSDSPGFTQPAPGRGPGYGRGGGRGLGRGFGRGFGRGPGRGFGRGRGAGGWWDPACASPEAAAPAAPDRQELTRRLDALTAELEAVRRQLGATDRDDQDPDEENSP